MGTEVRRLDAPEKSTGDAIFPGDIKREGMLTGKVLNSKISHAHIKRIVTDKALSVPGVIAVITAQDFPDVKTGVIIHDQPVLAREKIRYYGEPVAAVAAIDSQTADRALDLIELEIDELPCIFDFAKSIDTEAPLIHENYKEYHSIKPLKRVGNVCLHTKIEKGNIERGFAKSDEIFEDTYTVPVVHQASIEPRTVVAEMEHHGRLRLWSSTQQPFNIREGIAEALGLPMSRIRVIGTTMGGGFGGKGEMSIEPIAAMLALKTKKPVRLEMTRKEEFLSATPRHSMEISLKTGVKMDGTLLARRAIIKVDTGAYANFGPNTTSNAALLITGPYKISNLFIEGICVYTNKISCGPCRGPGGPQAHFAGETQLDRIALKLNIDPIELRLINALEVNDSTASGQVLGYVGYREVLTELQRSIEKHFGVLREVNKEKALGLGIAGGFWGMAGFGSSAMVRLNEDGTAVLSIGAVEIGTGSNTALSLLVSEGLGIPLEHITIISGDTDTCPYDFGAVGSRTTQAMGVAVQQAIDGVKKQLLDFAEIHLEAPRRIIAFRDSKIYVMEKPDVCVPIAKAIHYLTKVKGGPVVAIGSNTAVNPPYNTEKVESNVVPSKPFFCFGAQAAAVEVDKVTGNVSVLKVVAVHNVGKVMFRAGVEGQIQGGVAMGLGYALSEEAIFAGGKPVNDSFLDYRLPTMEDVPEIVPIIVEKENAKSPEDIRGIGEPSTIPTAAAIANGVHDAVGIRINHLPLTPERVYWGIKSKKTN
ncbi:xanthine dehydrogenase family protein molybdopterin-binding subunit [bacterium]|nr:xanthine dehydrogenase family protein molybdopterin-binding subunit [bacterium]